MNELETLAAVLAELQAQRLYLERLADFVGGIAAVVTMGLGLSIWSLLVVAKNEKQLF